MKDFDESASKHQMVKATSRKRWRLRDALKEAEVDELVDRRIHRPLAFLLILPLRNRGDFVTPTSITIAAMVAGMCSGIAFAMVRTGDTRWYVTAGLLLLLSVVLDCADGMFARLTNATSRLGQVLDGYADLVTGLAVWAGMGAAIAHGMNPWVAWPINVLSLATIVFHVGIYEKFRENFVRIANGKHLDPDPEVPENMRWLWDAAVGFFETGYTRCFQLVGGIAPDVKRLPPQRFRKAFSGPMQLLSSTGLGSHLFLIYLLAFVAAIDARHIFVLVHIVILVGTNVAMLAALLWWRRRERVVMKRMPAH